MNPEKRVDKQALVQDLLEAAIRNQATVLDATESLKKVILHLSDEAPGQIAQTVSESVVIEVKVVISKVAEQMARQMTQRLAEATKEAENAAIVYREISQSAKAKAEENWKKAVYIALATSAVVSLIVALVISWLMTSLCSH